MNEIEVDKLIFDDSLRQQLASDPLIYKALNELLCCFKKADSRIMRVY
jgi:hypothetical protein